MNKNEAINIIIECDQQIPKWIASLIVNKLKIEETQEMYQVLKRKYELEYLNV